MTNDELKYVGDEYEEDENAVDELKEELRGLYDLVLPPGVPQKIIVDVIEKFNLEIVTRKCSIKTIDTDTENLLTLRGELEVVNNAHDYIYQKMSQMYNYRK